MAASFPAAIKAFISKSDFLDVYLASHINDVQNEIMAIETALGINFAKAAGSDVAAKTDDTKFVTAKALKDGGVIANALISGAPYKQLWIAGWKPLLTGGAGSAGQIEMGTSKNVFDYIPFDPASLQEVYVNVAMPSDYTGGPVYAKFYWAHPATTTNFGVKWGIHGSSVANAEALDIAVGSGAEIADTGGSTSYLYISDLSPAMTFNGTPAAGELVTIRAYRLGADAADTLAVNAYLIGVMIYYPVG